MKKWLTLFLLFASPAHALTIPYVFSSGNQIKSAEVNADFSAVASAVNSHINASNPHNTNLAAVLASSNSCGSYNIDFNSNQALSMRIENVSADPACGSPTLGRMIWNTVDGLLKVCNGTSYVSIAGTGVNTLQSVLSAGNSAGSSNIDLNGNQLLHASVENVAADPVSFLGAGRLIWNTSSTALKVYTGSAWTAIGGAQGLSSVLGVSNSAGSTNIDLNHNQLLKARAENLSSDPGGSSAGRYYWNTSTSKLKVYDGVSWANVGDQNTLAQTMANGNSVGSSNLNMNGKQFQNSLLENLSSSPGTGQLGRIWFHTPTDEIRFSTSGSNRVVADTSTAQTITNKTMDGGSNTFQNIPDSALSANIGRNDTAQTISAKKTFSSAPQIAFIKTAAGTTNGHAIPDGLPDDTFALLNASQELQSKSLRGFTLTGNADFGNYIASKFRVEVRSSDPSPGNAGRMYYNSATGEIRYDDGSNIRALTANPGTASTTPWVLLGNSGTTAGTDFIGTTDAVDLVFKTNSTEAFRIKSGGGLKTTFGAGVVQSDASGNLSSGTISNSNTTATSANTASAIVARDASGNFSAGTITASLSGNSSTATALASNPTDCGANTFATAIDAGGNLTCSSVTSSGFSGQLGVSKGGTGADLSLTGGTSQVLKQTSVGGAVSVAQLACADLSNASASCSTDATNAGNISSGTLVVSRGGTGAGTLTANNLVVGNGTSAVTFIAPGSSRNFLISNGTTFASTALSVPTVQVFTTGSSATYTKPSNVLYLDIIVVGGGGGGGNRTTGGSAGADSIFGPITSSAGANGAGAGGDGGVGGTCSITTSGTVLQVASVAGTQGGAGGNVTVSGVAIPGGQGGSSVLGGGGRGGSGTGNGSGQNAATNSGSGGGGQVGSAGSTLPSGAGGGSAAFCEAIITSPSSTYTYTVGGGGSGASNAGNGAAGYIIVKEYYQ